MVARILPTVGIDSDNRINGVFKQKLGCYQQNLSEKPAFFCLSCLDPVEVAHIVITYFYKKLFFSTCYLLKTHFILELI